MIPMWMTPYYTEEPSEWLELSVIFFEVLEVDLKKEKVVQLFRKLHRILRLGMETNIDTNKNRRS